MTKILSFEDFSAIESLQPEDDGQVFEANEQNIQKLEDAITNKSVCVIDYRGEVAGKVENGIRYIEPFALGTNSAGNIVIRAWLLKGTSRTGKIDPSLVPGWRLYRVDRIFNIDMSHETFTVPRKGYNAQDSKMTDIIISASF